MKKIVLFLVMCGFALSVSAQIPKTLSFQGYLVNLCRTAIQLKQSPNSDGNQTSTQIRVIGGATTSGNLLTKTYRILIIYEQ